MAAKSTIGVSIDFTFDSSTPGPPYWIQRATGTITYSDASSSDIKNWKPEKLGLLDAKNGAAFTVNLIDANGTTTAADIGSWATTFIPRSPTTDGSPFGKNVNTIAGQGASVVNEKINLDFGNSKLKNADKIPKSWDWVLIVQVNVGGDVHCFASDPEMDVDPTSLTGEKKRTRRVKPSARAPQRRGARRLRRG